MRKEALLTFTVVVFLGKLIFNGLQGHFYASYFKNTKKAQHNMKLCS